MNKIEITKIENKHGKEEYLLTYLGESLAIHSNLSQAGMARYIWGMLYFPMPEPTIFA